MAPQRGILKWLRDRRQETAAAILEVKWSGRWAVPLNETQTAIVRDLIARLRAFDQLIQQEEQRRHAAVAAKTAFRLTRDKNLTSAQAL